jgi:hypothetical protein
LKLVLAGYRNYHDGVLSYAGSSGVYWSSTGNGIYSRYVYFSSGGSNMYSNNRAYGYSVRCLRD